MKILTMAIMGNNLASLQVGQRIEAEGELKSGLIIPVEFELETTATKAKNNGLSGEFHFYDPNSGFEIVKSSFTRAVTLRNLGVVDGTYIAENGSQGTFRVTATSNKSLGKKDSVTITLSNGYQVSGNILDGHVIIPSLKK